MKLNFLSSKNYSEQKDFGDCIVISDISPILVYDCGSEEHADRVIDMLLSNNIDKIDAVLSHNDSDHVSGLLKLKEKGYLGNVYTVCLLRHIDDLMEAIDDKRYKREKVIEKITEKYSNIADLQGHLIDIYDDNNNLISNVKDNCDIVAPDYSYMLETAARAIKSFEPDTIDGDSVINATSVCLKVKGNKTILLTGDSTFENIENHLNGLDYIQTPHHGREDQIADLINYYDNDDPIYIISDNKGDSKGGFNTDLLKYKAHKCTKDGDIKINLARVSNQKCLGVELK